MDGAKDQSPVLVVPPPECVFLGKEHASPEPASSVERGEKKSKLPWWFACVYTSEHDNVNHRFGCKRVQRSFILVAINHVREGDPSITF